MTKTVMSVPMICCPFLLPTGCPKVRATSNHPLNFGIGWQILKPFGMVNAHTLRFGLVYHTYFYVAKCPGKYGVCSGQNSE